MQWQGQRLHTWETAERLNPRTVSEYERTRQRDGQDPALPHLNSLTMEPVGFDRGLEAEKILGKQNCTLAVCWLQQIICRNV